MPSLATQAAIKALRDLEYVNWNIELGNDEDVEEIVLIAINAYLTAKRLTATSD